ncbi:hypothetical protein CDL15_Pgr000196 [Punica granatum]|uniref:Uncharacterized protein n=1 Tax=Punica granatum TaxID=22663 RepID=A0A218Y3Y3_PUNGR|nr:hypothetical protein CDL15_Pgr000196 [Punica granatum]
MSAEEFLAWISDVDRFFNYYGIPNDGSRVDHVIYHLKDKASTWGHGLQRNHIEAGKNLVFTWRRMKRLLNDRFLPLECEQQLFEPSSYLLETGLPLEQGKTNLGDMKIIDVVIEDEKVQVEDITSKRDNQTKEEEDVELKNQTMLERDTHVSIINDLSFEENILEVLISNSTKPVLMKSTLNSPQVELQDEIAIEDLSMVLHPIEAKFAKAYTTPPRKQQFKQRVGWRGKTKKSIFEELLERVLKEKNVVEVASQEATKRTHED